MIVTFVLCLCLRFEESSQHFKIEHIALQMGPVSLKGRKKGGPLSMFSWIFNEPFLSVARALDSRPNLHQCAIICLTEILFTVTQVYCKVSYSFHERVSLTNITKMLRNKYGLQ